MAQTFDPMAAASHPGWPGRQGKLVILTGDETTNDAVKDWVAEDPDHRILISRDALRRMLGCISTGVGTAAQEAAIAIMIAAMTAALLRRGYDVASDSTAGTSHPGWPGRQGKLVILTGPPGCGKTTWAKAWVSADPDHRIRISRDTIRRMLGCLSSGNGSAAQEAAITIMIDAMTVALLRYGYDVVADATNIGSGVHDRWRQLAAAADTTAQVIDLTVEVEECLRRIAGRVAAGGRDVPESVVRRMSGMLDLWREEQTTTYQQEPRSSHGG